MITRIPVFGTVFLAAGLFAAPAVPAKPDAAGLEFFEKNIRPILTERCYECHSAEKGVSKGGMTMDSRDGLFKGGDQGPAVVPGNAEKSLLLQAVHYTDPELSMPPKKKGGKLPDAQIALLDKWVRMGAPMPEGGGAKLSGLTDKARQHWAFRPVTRPALPDVKDAAWVKNPVDRFILAKLESKGLQPNPAADPEALLRRLSYDLVGLPPTSEQADAFVNAYEAAQTQDALAVREGRAAGKVEAVIARKVDELLASPHYGERWARHWMDTARYSDTNGKLDVKDSFEEYRYAYAWTYRDYVINAFNADKSYADFIVEQLAADRLPGIAKDDPRLAALGFITIGKRFTGVDDVIDERIDTTTKAFLGLTVACARCHDHKFDPIPAADYFSLHGVFASVRSPGELPEIRGASVSREVSADFLRRLDALQAEGAAGYYKYVREMRERYDKEMAGRLLLATVRRGSPQFGDYSARYKLELLPDFDQMRILRTSPITGPLARLAALPAEKFAEQAPKVLAAALADKKFPVNPLLAAALKGLQPKNLEEVTAVYQKVYNDNREAINAHVDRCAKPGHSSRETPAAIAQLASYPWPVPDVEDILDNENLVAMFNERKYCEDWQTRPIYGGINNNAPNAYFRFQQVNALRLMHPGAPAAAMVVEDVEKPKDSRIQIRGDKRTLGEAVPRRFLEVLSHGPRKPFTEGSGRLELARAIAAKDNPLTARVAVNRVWLQHFGEGFVTTPDDFGNMSVPPSHPELLDYLASEFMDHQWSLKHLHRLIVLSATYRQDSNPALNPLVVKGGAVSPFKVDEGNRLLWHGVLRRLDFEAIRDSMLVLTGRLDESVGGHPVNITDEPYSYRRSLYGYVDRRRVSETLSQFDYADPDAANSQRGRTIVPQQALYFMNNPFAVSVARDIAARADVAGAATDELRIAAMFRVVFQRRPTAPEVEAAKKFLVEERAKMPAVSAKPAVAKSGKARSSRVAKVAKASEDASMMAADGQMMMAAKAPAKTSAKSPAMMAADEPSMMMAEAKGAAGAKAAKGRAAESMMTTEVTGANLLSGVKNLGANVPRTPLTPVELLAQALIFSNEFVFVN